MRRANKIDRNQPELDDIAREIGAHVIDMTGDGKIGFDRLYIYQGKTYIVEVKDGMKRVSQRVLTETEADQMQEIEKRGVRYHIIEDSEQLLEMFGVL